MTNPYDALLSDEPRPAAPLAGPSAPAARKEQANPYFALIEQDDALQQTQRQAMLRSAVQVNPDEAGEAARLAKRYPAPADVLLRNLRDVRLQAAVDDNEARLATSPRLAEYMRTSEFAPKQAHDDLGTLASIEKFFSDTGGSARAGAYGASKGAAGLFRGGFEVLAQGLENLNPLVAYYERTGVMGGNPLRRVAEGFGLIGQANEASAAAARPKTEGIIASGFQSGIESLTQNILALPAALANPGAGLTAMVGMTGGQAYQDAREQGLRPEQAIPFAASQAAIEYATEKLPLFKLVGDVKAGAPLFKTILNQAALEIPGEQVATVLQDMNEWAVLPANQDKPFTEYLKERPSAAAQTLIATVVGTGGNVAVSKSLEKVSQAIDARQAQKAQAEQAAQSAQALMDIASQSKLRERNPEEFRALMDHLSNGAEIYVDAEVLNQLPVEQLQAMQGVQEQMPAAIAASGTVAVKVSDVLTLAPGTPLAETIIQNARVAPDGVSLVESQQAAETAQDWIKTQADQVIQSAEQQQAAQQSQEAVKQQVLEQLNTAGRFRPAVNEQYASFVAAFYSTMAARAGVTSQEMAAKYPLRVVSTFGNEPVLNQAEPAARGAGPQAAAPGAEPRPLPAGPADTPALAQGARGTFSPNRLEIALGANADLTTFLHETGHFFLEVVTDLASQPNAPADVQKDVATLMQWFGTDLAAWQAMTLDQQRPYHERFAESVEQYLMEGRAPSVELAPLFRRFRSWLLNVYKSVQNFLAGNKSADSPIQLSDEVRRVLDRLVASEDQIRQAEEMAGLVPDEEGTSKAIERLAARSLRDLKWTVGARSGYIKSLQKEAEATRKTVQEEIAAEIDDLPVVKAKQALDALEVNPDFAAATEGWKAKRAAAVEQARADVKARLLAAESPEPTGLAKGQFLARNKRLIENQTQAAALEWERANPKPVRSQNVSEADLEIVADSFGFDSADAMLQAVDAFGNKADVIQAMTDQRMLQDHGDLVDPQAIEQAANAAVHNEARARALASELRAQAEALNPRQDTGKTTKEGRRITVNALVAAAKQFGANVVERTLMRDMKSRASQHMAAERRAAARWQEATAAGKTADAIKAKQDQMLNHAAARAALEAAEGARKDLDYLKKFDKESTRKRLARDYLEQIDQLLEGVDLRQTSNAALDKRTALREWVQHQEDMGLPVSIPEALLDEARLKSWKEMTAAEFADLVDAVKNIEHLGRLKNKLLTLKDKRAFDQIVGQWVETIVENGGKPKPVDLEGRGRFKAMVQGFATSHRKIASLMRQMTGGKDGGPLWDAFVRPMNAAGTAEAVMIEKATLELAAIYKPVLALKGGLDGDKQFIPEIGASLSRGGRLAVALNWGNAQNRQRVMGGDNWTSEQVGAILSRLTPVEAQFVNDVWAYLDSYWPEIKAKQERVSGIVEKKVDAEPFALNLQDGTTVQMRGGYYPIKYDADRSGKADSQEAAEVAKDMMRGAFTRATTRRGHTKARVAEVNRPVRKSLDVITQHVTQVVHDLAWHEWIIDANRLLGNKSIEAAIRDHYGPDVMRTLKSDIEGIATADVTAQTALDAGLRMLRANISRSTMGLSFTTALLQPFGLTQSMARIGTGHVLRGAMSWGGDALRLESSLKKIGAKSDFMRLRSKTMNRELTEINQRVQGRSPTMIAIDRGLFFLTTKMQLVADVPTWLGAYEKALAQGDDEATAVARADQAVLDSQGGGQIKDLAEIQRKHPMLTQFYSYFSVTLNLMAEKTATTDFKHPKAVAGWLGDMALLAVIPAILPSLLAYALKGGDDDKDPEEWAKLLAKWQLSYLLGLGVGIRELSGAVEGFDYSGPPVGRVITDIGKAGKQTAQGEVDEPAVMAYIRLLGSAFGIPTVQAMRSYRGWVAWEEGDAPASSILFGPPPKD